MLEFAFRPRIGYQLATNCPDLSLPRCTNGLTQPSSSRSTARVSVRGSYLRHTFTSLLLAQNAPITYVSAQLGHADATTTLRWYAR